MAAAASTDAAPHIPVLLQPLLDKVAPVVGRWLDGTFGAGGYTRGLLGHGAEHVTVIDRDPEAIALAERLAARYPGRIAVVQDTFGRLDQHATALDGIVLDLGVSSMQLDSAGRGFSFQNDGPLDMRMGQDGPTAADLVNSADEETLADIIFHYGEDRAARRIARAIIRARETAPVTTTRQLAELVERVLPRSKPGQAHPATRTFQAIRIAVNDEFGELADALEAAERALKPGGKLAVVTFHSLEDRMVKRFFQDRTGQSGQGSRHAPPVAEAAPTFSALTRKAVGPGERELHENPRARSARLRAGQRTDAPPRPLDRAAIGMPTTKGTKR